MELEDEENKKDDTDSKVVSHCRSYEDRNKCRGMFMPD